MTRSSKASKLLQSKEEEVVTFKAPSEAGDSSMHLSWTPSVDAPSEAGDYDYLCTFRDQRHHLLMAVFSVINRDDIPVG